MRPVLCPSCAQVQQRGVRRITVEQRDSNQTASEIGNGDTEDFLV